MNKLKEVIRLLAIAQKASDNAKAYRDSSYFYYAKKTDAIEKAIKIINHNPFFGVRYGVGFDVLRKLYVTYFEIYHQGKFYQASFHTRYKIKTKGNQIIWDKNPNGSRNNLDFLCEREKIKM